MSEDQHKQTTSLKPYEAPKVIRVSLRPEEAVLGHCKITGSAGPVTGSCTSLACRTFGS